jgi:hypothetical protein
VNHVTLNNANVTLQKPVPTKVLAPKDVNQFPGENGPVKTNAAVQLVKRWLKIVIVNHLPPLPHHLDQLLLQLHNASTKPVAPEL